MSSSLYKKEITVPKGKTYVIGGKCYYEGDVFLLDEEVAKCFDKPEMPLPKKTCFPYYCQVGGYTTKTYTNQYWVPAGQIIIAEVPDLEGCSAPDIVDFDIVCGGCLLVGYDADPVCAAAGEEGQDPQHVTDGTAGQSNPSDRKISAKYCGRKAIEKLHLKNVTGDDMIVNLSYWCL